MTLKFVFVLSLFFTVSKHVSSSKLSSQLLTTENHPPVTSINASDILKANQGSNVYRTSLKNAENVKLIEAHFGTEPIHISKGKEIGVPYVNQTLLKVNSTNFENISLHSIPANEIATKQTVQTKIMQPGVTEDQTPLNDNSSENSTLHNLPVNEAATVQNVQTKMIQPNVIEDKTSLKINSNKAENISLHSFPASEIATGRNVKPKVMQPNVDEDHSPLKVDSSKAENISLDSFPVNETVTGENAQLKMKQRNILSHPREKEDITLNRKKYAKTMETRFTKVSPNEKRKTSVDIDNYALKNTFPEDFFKTKSYSQNKLQNLNSSNLKKGHLLETGPPGKRKIRNVNIYPEELVPIFKQYFPEDFTTKENYLDSNNFRKPLDLNIPDSGRHGETERYKNRNSPMRKRKGKKPGAVPTGYESFYFRAADETTTSSPSSYRTKIITIIVPIDEQGSTPESLVKIMMDKLDEIASTVSQTGTETTTAASTATSEEGETTSTISETGTETTTAESTATSEEGETTSTISETGTQTTIAASTTEITTEETGTKQTTIEGLLKVPPIGNLEKSETISSLYPEVNYHYHFHYFGRATRPTPPEDDISN